MRLVRHSLASLLPCGPVEPGIGSARGHSVPPVYQPIQTSAIALRGRVAYTMRRSMRRGEAPHGGLAYRSSPEDRRGGARPSRWFAAPGGDLPVHNTGAGAAAPGVTPHP